MKKSKLMMGILVASMGLLGTGYAAFTQTTTINTTATVGKLTLLTSLEREDILVDYNTQMSGNLVDYRKQYLVDNGFMKNSSCGISKSSDDTSETYTLTFDKLVPGKTIMVPIEVNNTGDVAAILEDVDITIGGTAKDQTRALVQYVDENDRLLFQKGDVNINGNEAQEISMKTPIKPGKTGTIRCFIRLDDKAENDLEGTSATVTFGTSFDQHIPSPSHVNGTPVNEVGDEIEAQ